MSPSGLVAGTVLLPAFQYSLGLFEHMVETVLLRLVTLIAAPGFIAALLIEAAQGQGIGDYISSLDRPNVAASMTQADLEAALLSGHPVIFSANATILLTNTITIRSNAAIEGNGRTVILDGQNRVRHFTVTNGNLRLKNLSLVNGAFKGLDATNGPGDPGFGGAIFQEGGALELTGCTFSNNAAAGGSGTMPSDLSQSSGSVDGGPAGGGALYCLNAQVIVTDCIFSANRAIGGHAGEFGHFVPSTHVGGPTFGGALFSSNSVLVLNGVAFSNNVTQGGESTQLQDFPIAGGSSYGGALAQAGGTATVSRCLFFDNTAQGPGGGLGAAGALFHTAGPMRIDRSTFHHNAALGGPGLLGGPGPIFGGSAIAGAIMNQSGPLEIRDSAIVLNRAQGGPVSYSMLTIAISGSGDGGGIENRGELFLVNCTVAENESSAGDSEPRAGRGWVQGGGISGNATLVNVTLARNSVAPGAGFWSGGANLAGDVLITNTILYCVSGQTNFAGHILGESHNLCSDFSASFAGPGSYNGVDPMLGPVADNGGPTVTVAISQRSPALSSADPKACPATDQRGVPRPAGAGCDMGAFELAPVVNVQKISASAVRIRCQFELGSTNRFEVSENLRYWEALGTAVADAEGQCEIQDPAALKRQWGFYRVIPVGP